MEYRLFITLTVYFIFVRKLTIEMKALSHKYFCPVCSSRMGYFTKVTTTKSLHICPKCDLRRLLPLPTKSELKLLYGREEYYTDDLAELHNDLTKDYSENSSIVKLYKKNLAQIKSIIPPPATLLDIGCARGVFLDLARKNGYKVFGLEMNKYAYTYAKTKFNLNIEFSTIEDSKYKDNFFDVIVAFDVIEHVVNPDIFIKKISKLLKTNGILVLGTPNSNAAINLISELLGKFGVKYPLYRYYGRGIEHLSIFNPANLRLLESKYKLTTIKNYSYSIPNENITQIPFYLKPFKNLITLFPYEFVHIAHKII